MKRASARVLVVGVGGLGCPAALALVDGGVGRLTLVDDDLVSLDNLHRQILYTTRDAGRAKVDAAAELLCARASDVAITTLETRLTSVNILDMVRAHDLVLDGTDSPATKFLLNDACVRAGVPLVHAGAVRWAGQLLVVAPGGPCLRCFFEGPPPAADGESCREVGVAGPLVGWVGALAAARALSFLDGEIDLGELWTVDGLRGQLRKVPFRKRPGCRGCDTRAPFEPLESIVTASADERRA